MKCPVCGNVDLAMTERQGVEIDYCPKCRGVWLDRGELDKLIERASRADLQFSPEAGATASPTARPQQPPPPLPPLSSQPQQPYYRRDDDDDDDHDHDRRRYKKRKSFWSEMFDD